jgi:pilus assembly protein CpaE
MTGEPSTIPEQRSEVIAPVPRITLQAFCETHDVAALIQTAITDRRMQKAVSKVQMGGPAAALDAFRDAPTPNVLLLESTWEPARLFEVLEQLSEVCDAGTRLVVIGHLNDILLYRELMKRGVSDYIVAPLGVTDVVRAVSQLYNTGDASGLGRIVAVYGAKGGVGSSTVAHNIAWSVSQQLESSTVLVDLDLGFGTAGLDFNQDPPQGVADAVFAPDRLDSAMLDRLLSRCSENLSLLAAPAILDKTYDLPEEALDNLLTLLRGLAPVIVLDIPHVWTAWARRVLVSADDILLVATPDLACLRNTKSLLDVCRAVRTHDRPAQLMLNQVGVQKRPEIAAAEFAKSLSIELAAAVAFDAQLFGTAANNGQMIAEVQPGGPVAQQFVEMAAQLVGKGVARKARRPGLSLLEPLLTKFQKRAAS